MRTTLAAAVLLTLTSTAIAGAGKPTSSQARKAAKAWLAALKGGDEPDAKALAALTAVPFVSAADGDGGAVVCPAATTAAADQLGEVTECLSGAIDADIVKGKLGAYHKGDLGTQYADHAQGVVAMKNAAIVFAYTECSGAQSFVAIAVVKADKDAKVAGVFAVRETCGE